MGTGGAPPPITAGGGGGGDYDSPWEWNVNKVEKEFEKRFSVSNKQPVPQPRKKPSASINLNANPIEKPARTNPPKINTGTNGDPMKGYQVDPTIPLENQGYDPLDILILFILYFSKSLKVVHESY